MLNPESWRIGHSQSGMLRESLKVMMVPIDRTDDLLFAAGTWVLVHNAKTAKFWTSSWLGGLSPASMFPILYEHNKQKCSSVADALHNENWIRDLMHSVTTPIFAEYVQL
jgi:hypothetical protein